MSKQSVIFIKGERIQPYDSLLHCCEKEGISYNTISGWFFRQKERCERTGEDMPTEYIPRHKEWKVIKTTIMSAKNK